MEVIDTSGQDELYSLVELAIRRADALILVFDLTSYNSFRRLEETLAKCFRIKDEVFIKLMMDSGLQNRSQHLPIVVAGNKSDLRDKRCVPADEVKLFCSSFCRYRFLLTAADRAKVPLDEIGVPYFECSAKMATNIQEVFHAAVRQYLKFRKYQTGGNGSNSPKTNHHHHHQQQQQQQKKKFNIFKSNFSPDDDDFDEIK